MSNFLYFHSPGDPFKPIVLAFHGTGGDEHQFTELLNDLAPGVGIFGVRGKVQEHGMNRYFARFAEGQLDFEDLAFRTQELADWLKTRPELENRETIALGYSNGANIAANLLLTNTFPLNKAILLRPMYLPTAIETLDLTGTTIQINAGEADPICPPEQSHQLAEKFTRANATVDLKMIGAGHNLTQADMIIIQQIVGDVLREG
ncbi:hypothetical protein CCB80_13035 [Armatimonadetes bacterium Uphvl-Ar1]|nr:hypothetical protein CCB80_13035 [Armatimonadetes bacterium Uphvl-Ar1]